MVERQIQSHPENALSFNNRGVLYYNEGKKDKAQMCFEKAVALDPDNVTFLKTLADYYYVEQGRIKEALKIYENILDENPDDLETLLAMGSIAERLGKPDVALILYNRVLAIDPGNVNAIEGFRQIRKMCAQFFLDISFKDLPGHYMSKFGCMHRNSFASFLKNYPLSDDERIFSDTIIKQMNKVELPETIPCILALMLYYHPHQIQIPFDIKHIPEWLLEDYCKFFLSYPNFFVNQGEVDSYFRYFKKLSECFFRNIQEESDSKVLLKMATVFTLNANYMPLYFSAENLLDLYLHRVEIAELALKLNGYTLDFEFPQRPVKQKKVKLGIFAKVIGPNSETFATLPIYEYLNREEFEIFIYVHQCSGHVLENHVQQLADKFIALPEDVKTSVDIIRAENLDVLFFGINLTALGDDLFAFGCHRMARFQCVHFCQPVSTGLKHMDYFFLGELIQENGSAKDQYREQIVRLDGSGICFDLRSSSAQQTATIKPDNIGIPDRSKVFVSGSNFVKIVPELRHLWTKLLVKVPESVLVLYPFGPAWQKSYPKTVWVDNFRELFSRHNIKSERLIVLEPLASRGDIKELLRHADVYLDAIPYSGATSLLDPLEVGIPPVVMEGAGLRFCQGAAILKELGVHELVVRSEDEYLELAGRLAMDRELRMTLREKILNNMRNTPPFLDPVSYAEKTSAALKKIVLR